MEATQTNTINNNIGFIAKLFYVNEDLVRSVYNNVTNDNDNNLKNAISLLSHFGKVSVNLIHNQNILSDHVFLLSKSIALTIIKISCGLILRNKVDTINNIFLDTALSLFVSTRQDIERVLNNIYDCIALYANDVAVRFSEDITNLNRFLEMRNEYYTQTAILGRTLTLISDVVKIDKSNKQDQGKTGFVTIFKIMRDYAFYDKVIAHKYVTPDKKDTHLFGVLASIIDKSDKSQIESVFKIINMFNGFSYSIIDKNQRNVIFLEEIDTEGKQPIIDHNVMEEFMKQIDNNIRKLFVHSSEAQYRNLTADITDRIHMCQKIADQKVFIELYSKYLQKRLMDLQMDDAVDIDKLVNVENNLAKLLKYDSSQGAYIKIMMMMNDIRGCDFINREFRNIPIKFEGNKYPKTFQDTFDRSLTDFMIVRKNVWDSITNDTENYDRINEPDFIKYYLDMFYDFHNKYFKLTTNNAISGSDRRKIKYLYNNSIVDMSYEFGETAYSIRSNVIQASILSYIIDNPNITAEELSNKMKHKLCDMYHCINSLLLSGLIVRKAPNKDNTDVKIQFMINPLFKSDSKFINLVQFLDMAVVEHNKAIEARKQQEHEVFKNQIKKYIIEIVESNINITQNDIIEKLKSNNKSAELDIAIVSDVINMAVLSGDIISILNDKNEKLYSTPIRISEERKTNRVLHSEDETVELTSDDINAMRTQSVVGILQGINGVGNTNDTENGSNSNKSRSKSGSNAKSESESESEDTEVYSDVTDEDENNEDENNEDENNEDEDSEDEDIDEKINKAFDEYENLDLQLSKCQLTRNMSISERLKITKTRCEIEASKAKLLEMIDRLNTKKEGKFTAGGIPIKMMKPE